jgi:hypothetical protein
MAKPAHLGVSGRRHEGTLEDGHIQAGRPRDDCCDTDSFGNPAAVLPGDGCGSKADGQSQEHGDTRVEHQ